MSNSHSQKSFIDNQAKNKGLGNLTVITGDVKNYDFSEMRYVYLGRRRERELICSFDRVLSIEMFEHMKNYEFLLQKVSKWLKQGGKLFIHIFCHKSDPYDMKEGN